MMKRINIVAQEREYRFYMQCVLLRK